MQESMRGGIKINCEKAELLFNPLVLPLELYKPALLFKSQKIAAGHFFILLNFMYLCTLIIFFWVPKNLCQKGKIITKSSTTLGFPLHLICLKFGV